MALTPQKKFGLSRAESGQGMAEALIAIPALLLLAAAAFQLFFLAAAQVQLQYAAFCAARVGAVRGHEELGEMKSAAARVLASGIGFAPLAPGACSVEVSRPSVRAGRQEPEKDCSNKDQGILRVQVRWNYPLLLPLVGELLGRKAGPSPMISRPTMPLKASWSIPLQSDRQRRKDLDDGNAAD